MNTHFPKTDFFSLDEGIWIAEQKTNVSAYDFQFSPLFPLSRPRFEGTEKIIARIGAISDYQLLYNNYKALGFELVNSPREHQLASELQHWYPIIANLTPKSKVYTHFPSLELVLEDFNFPIFIKGNRQTAKHSASLSIANTPDEFAKITAAYQEDKILHWQSVVCREYIPLKLLPKQAPDKVPLAFEFRTFWWKGQLVGSGNYWSQFMNYNWSDDQATTALSLAKKAVTRLQIPFIVIDLALNLDNEWIIIECNDAQESGYAGVAPFSLWQNILRIEKNQAWDS